MPDSRRWRRFVSVARPAAALLLTGIHPDVTAAPRSDYEAWRAECGSCHVAFPVRALSPREWSRVLAALDRHYGVDAGLATDDLGAVARYLRTQPDARLPAAGAALPRITTSAWFREKHDEVPSGTWQRPGVKSAANCSACHAGAEQGRFDEDSIRIPK